MNFTTNTENIVEKEEITEIRSGEISEYLIKIVFADKISPKKYSIVWDEPQIDTFGYWSSKGGTQHNITPDWWMRCEESRTASGMPLITLYNKANTNRITVALSDPATPVSLMAGAVEETGNVRIKIDLFSMMCSALKEYSITLRIDRRPIPAYKSIKDVRAWWDSLGYKCAHIPEYAKLPMYSTWYSFHQHTIPDQIINECKIAKEYGMDTVIVDDGWQTDDNSRGYAFCGDWEVCESKIPDMKRFVDDIHSLGMKFMIWFSVPFVGYESKNFERFKGKYLRIRDNSRAAVLDPRFKDVREFLTDIYAKSVEKYGWDGLKLDFIDSFLLSEESSADYENMDTLSVEEGLSRLLCETMEKLRRIDPEIMIEFRQSYVGPSIAKYGNIFRVSDCPNDPINNRVFSLGLRLTSDRMAVHSDMIMWNRDDTNEGVMYQLLGVMFAVPQISVRFDSITPDHRRALKNYLDFWRANRDILLNGELSVYGMDANYSMAESKKDGVSVAVLYQSVVKKVENVECEYIFNSTGTDGIYVDTDRDYSYELYDLFGNKTSEGKIGAGVNKLDTVNCGKARLF